MNLWSVVQRFSFRQLFRLSLLMLQNPLYMYPTFKATKQTMKICESLYGREHHKNGKANAVRHALWCILICRNIYKMTKNEEKSINWSQKVTDLHEKLAKNIPLETAMDLHNNKFGITNFETLKSASEKEIIAFLEKASQNAKMIVAINEIIHHKNDLVYLSER